MGTSIRTRRLSVGLIPPAAGSCRKPTRSPENVAWLPPIAWTSSTTFQAKTYTYDSYGRVASLLFPQGFQATNVAYDNDNELTTFNYLSNAQRVLTLKARGEVLEDGDPQSVLGQAQGITMSGNGAQVGQGSTTSPLNQNAPTTIHYDVRSNMATCSSDPGWVSDYQNYGTTHAYVTTYDAAGRQTGSGFGLSPTDCSTANASQKSTYDAENRVHTSNVYNALGTVT